MKIIILAEIDLNHFHFVLSLCCLLSCVVLCCPLYCVVLQSSPVQSNPVQSSPVQSNLALPLYILACDCLARVFFSDGLMLCRHCLIVFLVITRAWSTTGSAWVSTPKVLCLSLHFVSVSVLFLALCSFPQFEASRAGVAIFLYFWIHLNGLGLGSEC